MPSPILMTAPERLKAAEITLSKGIKTMDIGRCIDCGSMTSSGANRFCHKCATSIVEAHKAGLPIPMPTLSQLKARSQA